MTYEELFINFDLKGYKNILPSVGKTCFGDYWFVVCDEGDCHLFDENGKEDDINKVTIIYKDMISEDIKKIIIPSGVISIGYGAFYNCSELKSVTIPSSVTNIGNKVFKYCDKLMNVIIDKSIEQVKKNGKLSIWNRRRIDHQMQLMLTNL